jgi:hypothetical protein
MNGSKQVSDERLPNLQNSGSGKIGCSTQPVAPAQEPKPKAWRSIAVWPDTISVGNVVGRNESDDTHDSEEAAEAVCLLLERHGFGGNREVFPVSTRVEPVRN